jgi:hypothetical protein
MHVVLPACCLFFACGLGQPPDTDAEKLMATMHDKITSAKALSITVEFSLFPLKHKSIQKIYVGERNRIRHEVVAISGTEKRTEWHWVCDGQTLVCRNSNKKDSQMPAHEKLAVNYVERLANNGCLAATNAFSKQTRPEIVNSGFKLTRIDKVGDREAYVVDFVQKMATSFHTQYATLWIDTKTYLPLKRVTLFGMAPNSPLEEEQYRDFQLNPTIDPKLFELAK